MRRRPIVDPQAAVAQAVADLLNKFEYPDLDTQPLPALVGGGGGAPTVVVAASDALNIEKQKADFICTGTNDEDTIQAAADLIHAANINDPGRVLLVGGTFNLTSGVDLGNNITLQGMNRSTFIETSQTTGSIITLGQQCRVRELTVSGQAASPNAANVIGVDGLNATNCIIENVSFFDMGTCIAGIEDSIITGCVTQFVDDFVDAQDAAGVLIIGNGTNTAGVGLGGIKFRDGIGNCAVVGNFLGSYVRRTTNLSARFQTLTIANNTWVNPYGGFQDQIDIVDTDGLHIVGNNWHDFNGYDPLRISGCHGAVIADNQGDNMIAGMFIESSNKVQVHGNILGVGRDNYLGQHGIELLDCSDCNVYGNTINHPGQDTDNTYDGIHVRGDSDLNHISGNKIIGDSGAVQPRYAINIAAATCDDNAVVGNNFSDPGGTDYGTARFNDAGTGTITLWSSGGPNGDNIN